MIRLARILCPIDFSEFSLRALDHAASLARSCNAQLTVLHVFQNAPVMDVPPMQMTDEDRKQLVEKMTHFTSHLPPELRVELRIEEAPDVHQEILAQAARMNADLLVVGTHGRSGFERLLLGSIAEKLLRKAPCPLMVVPRRAPDVAVDAPVQFRTILCPVDFSDASRRALEFASALAADTAAHLVLLHVFEIPVQLQEVPASTLDVKHLRREAEAESARRLRELVAGQARGTGEVETLVREGTAYREILKVASERSVDLVVMGVQGRGAVDLFVFGSNTARVTRAAPCPVLVVRAR